MTHTFTLKAHEARNISVALSCCMSNEETRNYLCGVALQNDDTNGLMAIATDGHRLGKLKLPADCGGTFSVIMPRDAVAWLGKISKKEAASVEFQIHETTIVFICGGQSATFKLVDGNFPDWQRTMPNNPQPVVGFQAVLLAEIAESIKKTGATGLLKLCLVPDSPATSPALIQTGNDALEYVLMPMRM